MNTIELDDIQCVTIERTVERVRELEGDETITEGRAVEIACLEYMAQHLLCGRDTEEHR